MPQNDLSYALFYSKFLESEYPEKSAIDFSMMATRQDSLKQGRETLALDYGNVSIQC